MKNLDWPEAVWDAWSSFEQLHGSVQEVEEALDRIEKAQTSVNTRRAKEAEKAAYAAMQVEAEAQANALPVANASVPAVEAAIPSAGVDAGDGMDVDAPSTSHGTKRKADSEPDEDANKKARIETPVSLKRDRENSTVFVSSLPPNTIDADLSAMFKDCGTIREVKITDLPKSLVATVEFMDRDSVPAALTKDKKRIHETEIAVHLAWQSTLYVTNFPEKADDAFIRDIFGKYGEIFDVRWPSKKFKSSRRFCYVQYTSPDGAKSALVLHGMELEPGLRLSVLVSNPERRKERTDADANDREIYVAGLSKFATKEDLRKLFSTYGPVKEIRLSLDERGQTKGFAFVEFEDANVASSALAANNHDLKSRRIAVTLSDSRFRSKQKEKKFDVKNKSVRIKKLPAGTQEGLLQQTLEKIVPVKRVEFFTELNEAVVELQNAADAGKLLLHPDPIVFNGSTLQLIEESLDTAGGSRPAAPPTSGGLFIPRSATSRPRAGLGSKKARGGAMLPPPVPSTSASEPAPSSSAGPSKSRGQDDFRKMLSGS